MDDQSKERPVEPEKTESVEMNDEPEAEADRPVKGEKTAVFPRSIVPLDAAETGELKGA